MKKSKKFDAGSLASRRTAITRFDNDASKSVTEWCDALERNDYRYLCVSVCNLRRGAKKNCLFGFSFFFHFWLRFVRFLENLVGNLEFWRKRRVIFVPPFLFYFSTRYVWKKGKQRKKYVLICATCYQLMGFGVHFFLLYDVAISAEKKRKSSNFFELI